MEEAVRRGIEEVVAQGFVGEEGGGDVGADFEVLARNGLKLVRLLEKLVADAAASAQADAAGATAAEAELGRCAQLVRGFVFRAAQALASSEDSAEQSAEGAEGAAAASLSPPAWTLHQLGSLLQQLRRMRELEIVAPEDNGDDTDDVVSFLANVVRIVEQVPQNMRASHVVTMDITKMLEEALLLLLVSYAAGGRGGRKGKSRPGLHLPRLRQLASMTFRVPEQFAISSESLVRSATLLGNVAAGTASHATMLLDECVHLTRRVVEGAVTELLEKHVLACECRMFLALLEELPTVEDGHQEEDEHKDAEAAQLGDPEDHPELRQSLARLADALAALPGRLAATLKGFRKGTPEFTQNREACHELRDVSIQIVRIALRETPQLALHMAAGDNKRLLTCTKRLGSPLLLSDALRGLVRDVRGARAATANGEDAAEDAAGIAEELLSDTLALLSQGAKRLADYSAPAARDIVQAVADAAEAAGALESGVFYVDNPHDTDRAVPAPFVALLVEQFVARCERLGDTAKVVAWSIDCLAAIAALAQNARHSEAGRDCLGHGDWRHTLLHGARFHIVQCHRELGVSIDGNAGVGGVGAGAGAGAATATSSVSGDTAQTTQERRRPQQSQQRVQGATETTATTAAAASEEALLQHLDVVNELVSSLLAVRAPRVAFRPETLLALTGLATHLQGTCLRQPFNDMDRVTVDVELRVLRVVTQFLWTVSPVLMAAARGDTNGLADASHSDIQRCILSLGCFLLPSSRRRRRPQGVDGASEQAENVVLLEHARAVLLTLRAATLNIDESDAKAFVDEIMPSLVHASCDHEAEEAVEAACRAAVLHAIAPAPPSPPP